MNMNRPGSTDVTGPGGSGADGSPSARELANSDSEGSDKKSGKSKLRIAGDYCRRILAGMVLTYGALTVVPNPIIPAAEYCSTTSRTVSAPNQQTTEESRTCGGPGVERSTPYLLLVIFLLLPDVSEIGVPGLLTLKRRVEQQGERIERTEIRQDQMLQSLSHAISNVQTNVAVGIPEVLFRFAADREAISGGEGVRVGPTASVDELGGSTERVDAVLQELSAAKAEADRAIVAHDKSERDVKLLAWEAQYKQEISVLLAELLKIQRAPQLVPPQYQAAVVEAARQALTMLG